MSDILETFRTTVFTWCRHESTHSVILQVFATFVSCICIIIHSSWQTVLFFQILVLHPWERYSLLQTKWLSRARLQSSIWAQLSHLVCPNLYVLILDDIISEWHLTQNSTFKHTYQWKRKCIYTVPEKNYYDFTVKIIRIKWFSHTFFGPIIEDQRK